MKKNVILSTVAATVVTGSLLLGGCGNSTKTAGGTDTNSSGSLQIVVGTDGTVQAGTKVILNNNGSTTATANSVTCNDDTKPCCQKANPCTMKMKTTCSKDVTLNFSNGTDSVGAWDAYDNAASDNTAGTAIVTAVDGNSSLVPAFSGTAVIEATGDMDSMNFDFSTFVVCAITKQGLHAFNTSTNSAGYVLVLVEYGDGTKEWIKAPITRKSNGSENDQPFIDLSGLEGKMPAKITVYSVLLKGKPATGSSGSTGGSTL